MATIDTIRTNRAEGIGSSDAKRLIDGDWHRLYMEKVGETEPEDLSGVFRVQLGIYTETFHLDWLERKYACQIERPMQRFYAPDYPVMFAHLDGVHVGKGVPVETKHTSSDARLRDKAVYYMPQLQHVLSITGHDYMLFSIIAGNSEPEWCEVAANLEYQAELRELIKSFWWHVEQRVPPEIIPTATLKAVERVGATTPIDGLKPYDMTGNNEWANYAQDYIDCMAAAALFADAKDGLKKMMPADASECTGHGITIKRDKRGALRFGA